MILKFNQLGKIVSGKYNNSYLKIVDDTHGETGGIYIYISSSPNNDSFVYDIWYEDIDIVKAFLLENEVVWEEHF
jgi:hypothetical protein